MTDAELLGCFDHETHPDGSPKIELSDGAEMPSPKELFRRHCAYNCVTDPVEVNRLWAEREAKKKKEAKRG